MPKISVIIPVYNAEKYLKQCLESIVNQTFKDIEIICVNDGSIDNSLEILREYAACDNRIIVVNQTNQGAGIARNQGIEIARGEYIHFVDADDYIVDNAYENLYAIVNQNDLDFIKCKAYAIDEKTNSRLDISYYELNDVPKNFHNRIVNFFEAPDILVNIPVSPWLGLFKKDFVYKKHIRFNNLKCVNDRSFAFHSLISADKIMLINDYIVWHRRNVEMSLVSLRDKFFDCHFASCENIKNIIKELPKNLQDIILRRQISDIGHWYHVSKKSNSIYINEIEKSLRKFLAGIDKNLVPKNLLFFAPRMIKVSVIIPVYNVEKHIRQCLESVVNQTLKDIEIICVNDGSTDASLNILNEYAAKDSRILVVNQENLGVESARAVALEIARGEFIHFCDPDDWLSIGMYEKMIASLSASKADVVMCNTAVFDENGIYNKDEIKNYSLQFAGLQNIDLYNQKWQPVLWNKLFRKKIIDDNNIKFPYKTKTRRGYDEIFSFIYFLSSKTCFYLQDFLYNYLNRKNSLINSVRARQSPLYFDNWYNLPYLYKFIEERGYGEKEFNLFLKRYHNLTKNFFAKLPNKEIKISALKLSVDFFNTVNPKYGSIKHLSKEYVSNILMNNMSYWVLQKDLCLKAIEETGAILDELDKCKIQYIPDVIFKQIRDKKYLEVYNLIFAKMRKK
ncbi:MAG: glycosyltransferase [Elusimicrobiota bacterium]|jgi:glycosyltransferase involved in cell wall biosynthesis|nr:glycosyltransferase [Elusimicrobiota bacterium]